MGWLGRGLGQFGSDLGEAKDIRQRWQDQYLDMLMKNAAYKQQQLTAPLQLQELQQRVNQMGKPVAEGTTGTPGGGMAGITYDPTTGKYGTQNIFGPTVTPQSVSAIIQEGKKSLSAPDQNVADSLLSELGMGSDPAKVMDKWNSFYQGAAKSQKQKPPVVDVAKGAITNYDAYGNATDTPIYVNGKLNPALTPDQQTLVQSQITGKQNTVDATNDAALKREEATWLHQEKMADQRFSNSQSATDAKNAHSDAVKSVTEAISAMQHWQALDMAAQKINKFQLTSPGTWFTNDNEASSQSDIAKQDAEGKRTAAVQALKQANMTVPPWLQKPLGKKVLPPPPGGYVLDDQ
jgi:hypothetical protein